MKLHFVESMDEVLKIALEREIVALPLAATTPPVELVRGTRRRTDFAVGAGGLRSPSRGGPRPLSRGSGLH